jgi:hypothetical protein
MAVAMPVSVAVAVPVIGSVIVIVVMCVAGHAPPCRAGCRPRKRRSSPAAGQAVMRFETDRQCASNLKTRNWEYRDDQ